MDFSASGRTRRSTIDRSMHKDLVTISHMNLQWIPFNFDRGGSKHSHRKTSRAWEFMGQLVQIDSIDHIHISDNNKLLDCLISDLLYCKMCFEEQMSLDDGQLAKVYCTAKTTSSGNHLAHAASRHGKIFDKKTARVETDGERLMMLPDVEGSETEDGDNDESSSMLLEARQSADVSTIRPFDFNKDLILLACSDLEPLSVVENNGFKSFCDKHVSFELPGRLTLTATSLTEVYCDLKVQVLNVVSNCIGGTLMFDRWTDSSTTKHFFAIRFSYVNDWTFQVLTLSVQPVADFSVETLLPVVQETVGEFVPSSQRCVLFETTDSGTDMKQLSTTLEHDRFDCIGHCINLLLTVDSLNQIPEIQQLIGRCIDLVGVIHSMGYMADGVKLTQAEVELYEKVNDCQKVLALDRRSPVFSEQLIVTSIPSRWTVTLELIDCVLHVRKLAGDILHRIGRTDLCLSADDYQLLTQLQLFLRPFEQFTILVSECSPNLSLVPLLRTRVVKMCVQRDSDCVSIATIKCLVSSSAESRLPLTPHIKLNVCFEPAVRDVVLSRVECEELLTTAYNKLTTTTTILQQLRTTHKSAANCWATDIKHDIGQRSVSGSSAAKRLRLSLLMESVSTATATASNGQSSLADEIRRYMSLHDEEPALEFWKQNADSFPILSTMSQIFLAASPGAVQFNSLFTTSGLHDNSKLSNIAPYRLNMTSFIHDNYAMFN